MKNLSFMSIKEIASGLLFPEGPIAMPDGSIIVVEIARETLSRVQPDGRVEVIANLGGGPNGAAIGPDGAAYVCNNGGFEWQDIGGCLIPGERPADYSGGRIERVNLETGAFDVLYSACDGIPLNGPNDIVFDAQGGFYFTDLGKHYGRQQDRGAVFYARADGSMIKEVAFPMIMPNGVGLSPDEKTLYVAESATARLWAFDLAAPGMIALEDGVVSLLGGGRCLAGVGGMQGFDSLAVDIEGNVCVGTILNGGITAISPADGSSCHYPMDDAFTTNICFGGDGLKTAYITLSSTGRLVSCTWPVAGLPLNFLNK